MNSLLWRNHDNLPLEIRIKRAAFAMTMLIVVILGGMLLILTLSEILSNQTKANRDSANFIGKVLSVDIKSQLNSVKTLSQSSLVWTALTDSAGRDAHLRPFLQNKTNSGNMPMHLLDYRGRSVLESVSSAHIDSSLAQLSARVLADRRPRFATDQNAEHSALIVAFPVFFPYTQDAIGVLVGEIDLSNNFSSKVEDLGAEIGIEILHQGRILAAHRHIDSGGYFPASVELNLQETIDDGPLVLKLYSTSNPWIQTVTKYIVLSIALAALLGTLVWRIAGLIARRITLRLTPLTNACVAISKGHDVTIPQDDGMDEVGVLSRTLQNAISSYRQINTHLEQLVAEKTRGLSESESRFRRFFENNSSVMLLIDPASGEIRDANYAAANFYGYPHEEMAGMHYRYINLLSELASRPNLEGEGLEFISRHQLFNGDARDVEVYSTPIESDGRTLLFAIVHDISERTLNERELRIAATAFEVQEGILITDADINILRVNKAFSRITGYQADEVIGHNPSILNSGYQDTEFYAAMWDDLHRTGEWEGEIWNRRKNGEIYPEYLTITATRDVKGNISNYVAAFNDITASKKAEEEIKGLAFYDPLTRLPNRRLLLDRLTRAQASSARNAQQCALLFIDLDHFKSLNDTLGHDIGDLLLQQVAQRLQTCVRDDDTVARQGGDEFVLMLENLSESTIDAAKQAEKIAEKILLTLNQTYYLGTHAHHNTPSIGITLFSGHQTKAEELFKQADIAMYQSKSAGRNTLRFYDPTMQAEISAQVALELDLRRAVSEHSELLLYYQTQVDDADHITGVEALIRWNHPEQGLISPAKFIPLAEESGLILPLGHWVLTTACRQLASWSAQPGREHLSMAVNISPRQFWLPTFVEEVLTLINYFKINPAKLKLEITESMTLDNVDDIIAKMTALKSKGINFSMDDFGTGYSSLQYLKKLPLSQLKIDQSFVRDIANDSGDQAIVRTVIAMAQSLDLNVIAEGVETKEQRAILLSYGCSNYQGYLFGKPVPIEQLEIVLTQSP